MTVTAFSAASCRVNAVAAHAYTVPVVRELPSQPVRLVDSFTW